MAIRELLQKVIITYVALASNFWLRYAKKKNYSCKKREENEEGEEETATEQKIQTKSLNNIENYFNQELIL